MAGLRRSKDKYFARIRYFDENDRRLEKTIPLKTNKQEIAERMLEQINKQEEAFNAGIISLDEIQVQQPTELAKLFDDFFIYLEVKGNTARTISAYKYTYGILNCIYDDINFELLSQNDFTDLLRQLRKQYTNSYSINVHLRNFRAFLNWAVDTGRLKKLPFKIKTVSIGKKKPRYFSDNEMKQILCALNDDPEVYANVYVHWKTGMRIGELVNTYYEKGFIKTYKPLKHGIERSIPIDQDTEEQYHIAKKCKFRRDTVSKKFLKVIRKLGLYYTRAGDKRTFHCLRNTFAVRKYYETNDIFKVQVLLGHANIDMTTKYAQFDLKELAEDFCLENQIE